MIDWNSKFTSPKKKNIDKKFFYKDSSEKCCIQDFFADFFIKNWFLQRLRIYLL